MTIYCFGSAAEVWWNGIRNKLTRLDKLSVWQIPAAQAQALAKLAARSMQWQLSIQDGQVWLSSGGDTLEITPQRLMGTA